MSQRLGNDGRSRQAWEGKVQVQVQTVKVKGQRAIDVEGDIEFLLVACESAHVALGSVHIPIDLLRWGWTRT